MDFRAASLLLPALVVAAASVAGADSGAASTATAGASAGASCCAVAAAAAGEASTLTRAAAAGGGGGGTGGTRDKALAAGACSDLGLIAGEGLGERRFRCGLSVPSAAAVAAVAVALGDFGGRFALPLRVGVEAADATGEAPSEADGEAIGDGRFGEALRGGVALALLLFGCALTAL